MLHNLLSFTGKQRLLDHGLIWDFLCLYFCQIFDGMIKSYDVKIIIIIQRSKTLANWHTSYGQGKKHMCNTQAKLAYLKIRMEKYSQRGDYKQLKSNATFGLSMDLQVFYQNLHFFESYTMDLFTCIHRHTSLCLWNPSAGIKFSFGAHGEKFCHSEKGLRQTWDDGGEGFTSRQSEAKFSYLHWGFRLLCGLLAFLHCQLRLLKSYCSLFSLSSLIRTVSPENVLDFAKQLYVGLELNNKAYFAQ